MPSQDARPIARTRTTMAGKSEKQARRDVARLRELGLIVPGDQSLADHLPPGQRPTVYDLALHVRGPKPTKASRNKSGIATPPMDGRGPFDGRGPTQGTPTPPMDAGSTPPIHGSQTKHLNNQEEQSSSRSRSVAFLADRLKVDDEEAAWISKAVLSRAAGPIQKGEIAYLKAIPADDLAALRDEYRVARTVLTAGARPDHCGRCDPRTRQVELQDGRPARCPRCHPLRGNA